jgi:hypothetical protein
MLLLHKPFSKLTDLKGTHETYIPALNDFLAFGRPQVPDCLIGDISRARADYLFRDDEASSPPR